jgi:CheY-like chemotaxis protein
MLEGDGYRAFCVDRGEEALALLGREGDVIAGAVLDLTMPGMSGEETFEALRKIRPELPVLCCSGYGDEVGARWLEGKSRVAFLAKPFAITELRRSLCELFEG